MILTPATTRDVPRLLRFRTDAAAWLSQLGTDQWSTSYPEESILGSVQAGEVFVLRAAPGADLAATITLDTFGDPLLWTEAERSQPARYVHKLTVDRAFKGLSLGSQLLDWAGTVASSNGCTWLRLDAWTTNASLHRYYQGLGFAHIRTVHDPETGGSGWVAQRPAVETGFGFVDQTGLINRCRESKGG
ncbi:GNAT family N-acetyltransferase [Kitasatospora sp. NPDC086801]|uniref:GNAT family N-acetyltransferase n=1 Tax=Kitasatospora sp. NPDC086801 TaxID=3364066 RepID=UPI0037F191DD